MNTRASTTFDVGAGSVSPLQTHTPQSIHHAQVNVQMLTCPLL